MSGVKLPVCSKVSQYSAKSIFEAIGANLPVGNTAGKEGTASLKLMKQLLLQIISKPLFLLHVPVFLSFRCCIAWLAA